jgi:hypothetical protein
MIKAVKVHFLGCLELDSAKKLGRIKLRPATFARLGLERTISCFVFPQLIILVNVIEFLLDLRCVY